MSTGKRACDCHAVRRRKLQMPRRCQHSPALLLACLSASQPAAWETPAAHYVLRPCQKADLKCICRSHKGCAQTSGGTDLAKNAVRTCIGQGEGTRLQAKAEVRISMRQAVMLMHAADTAMKYMQQLQPVSLEAARPSAQPLSKPPSSYAALATASHAYNQQLQAKHRVWIPAHPCMDPQEGAYAAVCCTAMLAGIVLTATGREPVL